MFKLSRIFGSIICILGIVFSTIPAVFAQSGVGDPCNINFVGPRAPGTTCSTGDPCSVDFVGPRPANLNCSGASNTAVTSTSGGISLTYTPGSISADFDINPTPFHQLTDFTERFIPLLTGVAVLITILVFMIGGGFWIFSAGNESLVERGKDMMIYSTIGILLILGSYVVVQLWQLILYAIGT